MPYTLESTYLKVHVYHIIELFIYAFKFQFIVNILYVYVIQKIKSFIYIKNKSLFLIISNVLLTLIRWSRSVVRLVIGRHH